MLLSPPLSHILTKALGAEIKINFKLQEPKGGGEDVSLVVPQSMENFIHVLIYFHLSSFLHSTSNLPSGLPTTF